jgi:hypothetical protein
MADHWLRRPENAVSNVAGSADIVIFDERTLRCERPSCSGPIDERAVIGSPHTRTGRDSTLPEG